MQTELDAGLAERLLRIEQMLQLLIQQRTVKEWYTTAEVAHFLRKAEYTVREWCRLGRIHASKRQYARGAYPEWRISHDELTRIENEGLLPIGKTSA
jgi:hypothetical protein